jgi:hypothetical protein
VRIRSHQNGGTDVVLDGEEFATAIDAYLTAHTIHVSGPRTISAVLPGISAIAGNVEIYVHVDPSGRVVDNTPSGDSAAPVDSRDELLKAIRATVGESGVPGTSVERYGLVPALQATVATLRRYEEELRTLRAQIEGLQV